MSYILNLSQQSPNSSPHSTFLGPITCKMPTARCQAPSTDKTRKRTLSGLITCKMPQLQFQAISEDIGRSRLCSEWKRHKILSGLMTLQVSGRPASTSCRSSLKLKSPTTNAASLAPILQRSSALCTTQGLGFRVWGLMLPSPRFCNGIARCARLRV
jgi:hypothetical protein